MEEDGENSSVSLESEAFPSLNLYNKVGAEEKGFAPVDIEIQIQNERIMSIFNETIAKTEVAVFLSLCTLKEINFDIRKVVTRNDFEFIRKMFKEGKIKPYEPNHSFNDNHDDGDKQKRDSDGEIIIYKPIRNDQLSEIIAQPEEKILPELSKVINIILSYPELKPVIQREIQWFRHIAEKEKTHLHDSVLFLDSLIRLKSRIEEKISVTALEKLKKDIVQRNLNRTNKMLKAKIMDITEKLKEENSTFHHIFKQKDAIIKQHQEELDLLKNECVTLIRKKILDSERIMMRDTEAHNTNYELLVEKEREVEETYEDLLKVHLENEKALRTKRFKIETQLVNWLRKYDTEVGDKQGQLDELTNNYEDEKIALAELQREFEEQEKIYKPLMADKEAEYQADLAVRVRNFALNYAARKVQRRWRAILAAQAAKKKKKKKGKK